MARDSRGIISKIGTKRFLKIIMKLYDDKIKIKSDNYSFIGGLSEFTLFSELLFLELKRLHDSGCLLTFEDGRFYQLSETASGVIDWRRSFDSGVLLDNKVYTFTKRLTYANSLYKLVRDALFIANKYLSDESCSDSIKIIKKQNRLFKDYVGLDIKDGSTYLSRLSYNISKVDSFLENEYFESHYLLLCLCRIVFILCSYYENGESEALTLDNAIEFILQQFCIIEFRRFLRTYHKYLPFSYSLQDKDRDIFKSKSSAGTLQTDGVLKLTDKTTNESYESCIIDVKTNLKFKRNSSMTPEDSSNYSSVANLYKMVSYCTSHKSNKKNCSVKPFGIILHIDFNNKNICNDIELSTEFEQVVNECSIRYAVKNFKKDNDDTDMTDLFKLLLKVLYGVDLDSMHKVHFKYSDAKGIFNSSTGELIVLKGSRLVDGTILDRDKKFKSPSGAGSFIYGKESNGWTQWVLDANNLEIDSLRI